MHICRVCGYTPVWLRVNEMMFFELWMAYFHISWLTFAWLTSRAFRRRHLPEGLSLLLAGAAHRHREPVSALTLKNWSHSYQVLIKTDKHTNKKRKSRHPPFKPGGTNFAPVSDHFVKIADKISWRLNFNELALGCTKTNSRKYK